MIRPRKLLQKICHWLALVYLVTLKGSEVVSAKPADESSLGPPPQFYALSNASSSLLQFQHSSSLSTLFHKIKTHNDSLIAQLSKSGSDLHKLLHKLKKIHATRAGSHLHSQDIKTNKPGRVLGVNKIAAGIPKYITNNTRLKRQLEGIFHVKEVTPQISPPINVTTETPITAVPSKTLRFNKTPYGSVFKRIRSANSTSNGQGGSDPPNNKTITANTNAKKEKFQPQNIKEDKKIATITNFHSKKSNPTERDLDANNDLTGKRNFTKVEIIEIARKTIITEDNKEAGKYKPTAKFPKIVVNKKTIDLNKESKNAQPVLPQHRPRMEFRQVTPRLRLQGFRKLKDSKIVIDSTTSATQPSKSPLKPSVRYKAKSSSNSFEPIPSATTALPIEEKIRQTIQHTPQSNVKRKPVEVKVDVVYEETIPYNDQDVDQEDLKDYLDGHSTFGAKGNFKHTVTKNITSFVPTSPVNVKANNYASHVRKRNPIPRSSQRKSRANNEITVEQANVKQRAQNPKTTVYTATGAPILEADQKPVFQYSSNKDKPNQFPKLLKSTLDELYRQGHPAVAKAPEYPETREPYGAGDEQDYNPFKTNLLVDDLPPKFDPQSDKFYGNPRPDKDKLAQSNRPEPSQVQVENEAEDAHLEYQEEERKEPPTQNNDKKGRHYYKRVYEPPEYDSYNNPEKDRREDDYQDTFIKEFVSLDDNFQPLPKPSADEENFRTLIPQEADTDDQLFEPNGRVKERDDEERDSSRTTSRSRDKDDRRSNEDERGSHDDYSEGPEYEEPEDFDQSYVDALKSFDDEIKQIQENERSGNDATPPASHFPTSTGEPLVITSPGPAVNYQERHNAPLPNVMTPPTHEEPVEQEEDNEEEEEEEEEKQEPRPRDSNENQDSRENRSNERDGSREEEPEEEEEQQQPEEETTPALKEDEDEDKNKDESIKINQVHQEKKDGLKEDKSGNLDEDISNIEMEFQRRGTL